jgi:hypothetical protein
MKTYTVHELIRAEKPNKRPSENAVFVEETVAIWAILFPLFWFVFHGDWSGTLGYILIGGTLTALTQYSVQHLGAGPETKLYLLLTCLTLGLNVCLGWFANDIRRWSLGRRNYEISAIVAGLDLVQAERRYFDDYAPETGTADGQTPQKHLKAAILARVPGPILG